MSPFYCCHLFSNLSNTAFEFKIDIFIHIKLLTIYKDKQNKNVPIIGYVFWVFLSNKIILTFSRNTDIDLWNHA